MNAEEDRKKFVCWTFYRCKPFGNKNSTVGGVPASFVVFNILYWIALTLAEEVFSVLFVCWT